MFRNLTDALTHPAALPVIGILLLVLLVFLTLSVVSPDTKPRERQFSDNPMMNALGWAGVVLALPGVVILIAAGWELIVLAWNFPSLDTQPDIVRWHSTIMLAMLAAIGAIFTLGFAFIRSFATERQTRATEEALFNDKINAAADDLHARRLVTKKPNRKKNRWDYWQDDIVKRNAAIDRLEGLAEERPDTAPRIARMLSVYVRELSSENKPQKVPKGSLLDELRVWAQSLAQHRRSDMENAAQMLGRLQKVAGEDPDKVQIDLRRTNLQGNNLGGMLFNKANLTKAQMQGAYLGGAEMQGAGLVKAQMQGAGLIKAQMQGADLRGAQMRGAILIKAQMQGADLREAEMQGADLRGAQMQGANLIGAQMDSATSLRDATFQAASLREVDYTNVDMEQAQVDVMFGDESVTLPAGLTRPDDWPQEDLEIFEFLGRWRAWQKERGFDGG